MSHEMINYEELYRIMWDKYKATHDELRYWIALSERSLFKENYEEMRLKPYLSDIPIDIEYWPISGTDFHFPQDRFYKLRQVDNFNPNPRARFVYLRDLTKRDNWHSNYIASNLLYGNRIGVLRFYDHLTNEFTLHKSFPYDSSHTELWCNSSDASSLTSDPESFFLIYDILTMERILFNRNLDSCRDELYGKDRNKTDDD
jgi:hypothetical protein